MSRRTSIIIKGTYISIIIALMQGVLTFWRTSVIISYFGIDINSIIAASSQVFSYLILLESGVGAAYLFKMYEPFSKKDYKRVNSLYLGLSDSLKKIAIKMYICIILSSIIYPLILSNNSVGYFNITVIILLLGVRFVYPYYFTVAKKNILIINELQYLVSLIDGTINCCIMIVEIILIKYFSIRVEFVLLIGIIFFVISNEIYNLTIKRRYASYTKKDIEPSFEGNEMTKDIIVHQIGSLANSHIDTMILSVVDMFLVTVYTSYNSVMTYPVTLINKIVSNLRASLGLKLSKNDDNVYSVFKEIMSLNYFVAAVITSTFILMINKFITLWIGEKFLLDEFCVILFGLILVHKLIINTIYAVRDGKGLYKESKNYTILTAITNLVLSAILVKPFGIKGLLISTIISTYLIMDYGNFRLVYNKIFNKSMMYFYKDLLLLVISITCSVGLTNMILKAFLKSPVLTWKIFIIESLISIIISIIIITVLLLLFNKSFKRVINRILINMNLKRK